MMEEADKTTACRSCIVQVVEEGDGRGEGKGWERVWLQMFLCGSELGDGRATNVCGKNF